MNTMKPVSLRMPQDVRAWCGQKLVRHRSQWLLGEGAWPLCCSIGAPLETYAVDDPTSLRDWIAAWQKEVLVDGVSVEWITRRWPRLGAQRLPIKVCVTSPEACSRWLGLGSNWNSAASRLADLTRIGCTPEVAARQTSAVESLVAKDFDRLLRVLEYAASEHEVGLYLRQLPIRGVHTKWIEARRGLIGALLSQSNSTTVDVVDHLGCQRPPARLRIRVLCPNLRASIANLRDIEAPTHEIAALQLVPSVVLIVENLPTGLALPDLEGVVAILGRGYAVSVFSELAWVRNVRVLYWGDIDTHGFSCLAQTRRHLENVTSLLMDEQTLLENLDFWGEEPSQANLLDSARELTASELAVFDGLRTDRWGSCVRLEQERIPWSRALQTLRAALIAQQSCQQMPLPSAVPESTVIGGSDLQTIPLSRT